MAKSFAEVYGGTPESSNKIGVFQSMLAGVGSGLISIPKGLFSLGASLMDLGVNTGKAAEVEKWFDDLTDWDEKAEATAAGKLTELLVNIGAVSYTHLTLPTILQTWMRWQKQLLLENLQNYWLT